MRCSNQWGSRMRSTYPADSRAGTNAPSSAALATARTMSITGLAARPDTDVDPACSINRARLPSVARMRSASRPKSSGQCGS
jgi:hypothetical protein